MPDPNQNFFRWYMSLFSADDKTRVGAWSATITTLTFLIVFIIRPSRKYVISLISKCFGKKTPSLKSFKDIEIRYSKREIKNHIKIIVIDDDDIFPVDGFRHFGYNINKWHKLDGQRLKQLHDGEFEIVVLDIYGVAKDIAENDGLDVLQDLKSHNPSQVVIAYSGQSFDFSKNKFWELADEKISKPTPFVTTQTTIDHLIERTFTVAYHEEKIKVVLSENNLLKELERVENLFICFKEKNAEPDWYKELSFLTLRGGDIQKLVSILTKLFSFSILIK